MEITDKFINLLLSSSRQYTLVTLCKGDNYNSEEAPAILWEHGRRNFELRDQGKLAIICPITDEAELKSIGIYTTDMNETRKILDEDSAIMQNILKYKIYNIRSFSGDRLP